MFTNCCLYLGRKCRNTAESCKFSHETLSETMRAILIKHIETAPREILGDFPRLTREETIQVFCSKISSAEILLLKCVCRPSTISRLQLPSQKRDLAYLLFSNQQTAKSVPRMPTEKSRIPLALRGLNFSTRILHDPATGQVFMRKSL